MNTQKINLTDLDDMNSYDFTYFKSEPIRSIKPKQMKKFIQHIPSFVSGIEPQCHEISGISDVLNLDFVKKFTENEIFYGFAVSVDAQPGKYYNMRLMAMYDFSEEYYGCKSWRVVGKFENVIMYETNLPDWKDLKAGHKATCLIRKIKSCDDIMGTFRSDKLKLKVIHDLGLNYTTIQEFNKNYKCDCGLKK